MPGCKFISPEILAAQRAFDLNIVGIVNKRTDGFVRVDFDCGCWMWFREDIYNELLFPSRYGVCDEHDPIVNARDYEEVPLTLTVRELWAIIEYREDKDDPPAYDSAIVKIQTALKAHV